MKITSFLSTALLGLALTAGAQAPEKPVTLKFDFGSGKVAPGYTQVTAGTTYSGERGYGLDFGSTVTATDRGGRHALTRDFVTSDKPFYFSVDLPEGNYNVTVTFGDSKGKSTTTVKTESRRLMLEKVQTAPGKFETRTFTVNIKNRKINNSEQVSLKPREHTKLDWDDKLTLEFNESRPCVNALEITKVDNAITVFLAGNSTVVNQDDEPWAAWGQMIPRFFKPGVAIANHAESGLTLGSFMGSKRLQKIMSIIKPGDYLFIEFGHNDQKEKGPDDGAYKSYTERLRHFVNEAKQKGAIPVILTSTTRRTFEGDKIVNSLGDYPEAARKVAREEGVALIDLNAMTTTLFEAMGVEQSLKAFVHYPAGAYPGQDRAIADNTHFNPYGAYQIAKCVVEGIKANKLGLADYLVNDITAFDPARPDALEAWNWPESPKSSVVKPDGN